MHRRLILLFLIALATPAMGQSNADPVVEDVRIHLFDGSVDEGAVSSVDLVEDHGKRLELQVDASDSDFGGQILLIEATFIGPTTFTLRLNAPGSAGGTETWKISEPVDDPRLVKGEYLIALLVLDRNGGRTDCLVEDGAVTCPSGTTVPTLDVTVQDAASTPLRLGFLGIEKTGASYPAQTFGISDALLVDVSVGNEAASRSYLLKDVKYRLGAGSDILLRAPYRLSAVHFHEGGQDVTVTATDRAGRTQSAAINIFLDTTPPAVTVAIPGTTYQNVTFAVALSAADALATSASVRLGNVTLQQTAAVGASYEPFSFQRSVLGNGTIIVTVMDAVGNTYLQEHNISTVPVYTDSTVEVSEPTGYLLPGDDVVLTFTASQKEGVVSLPMDLELKIQDKAVQGWVIEVPLDGGREVEYRAVHRPGIHNYSVTVFAGIGINETDVSDQVAVGDFEVFLGKVVRGDQEYYIRVGPDGLPVAAVSTTGAIHNVTLSEVAGGSVYAFSAGDQDLFWDPSQRTTVFQVPEAPGEESPGLPLLAVLALLGVLARRRK